MSKKHKIVLIILSAIGILTYGIYYFVVDNPDRYIIQEVGRAYFASNFEYLGSEDLPTIPFNSKVTKTHYYKFIPFSKNKDYLIEVVEQNKFGFFTGALPHCAIDTDDEDRCIFPFSYDQAYESAITTLGEKASIVLQYDYNTERYQWKASKIDGDPSCPISIIFFYIDTETGSETIIQVDESPSCA